MRQVVLDTETTGIGEGHRIIEIGCVEVVERKLTGRHYHRYINPERDIDLEAQQVHGISNEWLVETGAPVFSQVAQEFREFINDAELVIHNAAFDVGMMDAEFSRLNMPVTREYCTVLDTLSLARELHPGSRVSLDALCKRYGIDNSHRELHGALLDAEILADVYLLMTGGQTDLALASEEDSQESDGALLLAELDDSTSALPVINANPEEIARHEELLSVIDQKSSGALWRRCKVESAALE